MVRLCTFSAFICALLCTFKLLTKNKMLYLYYRMCTLGHGALLCTTCTIVHRKDRWWSARDLHRHRHWLQGWDSAGTQPGTQLDRERSTGKPTAEQQQQSSNSSTVNVQQASSDSGSDSDSEARPSLAAGLPGRRYGDLDSDSESIWNPIHLDRIRQNHSYLYVLVRIGTKYWSEQETADVCFSTLK